MTRVVWHGAEAKAKARAGAVRGLQMGADYVLKASQAEVPVAAVGGGFTKESGEVAIDDAALRAAVSYSGPADKPKLPIWVHEDMTAQHPAGQAKFLETPVNVARAEKTLDAIVAREVDKALG